MNFNAKSMIALHKRTNRAFLANFESGLTVGASMDGSVTWLTDGFFAVAYDGKDVLFHSLEDNKALADLLLVNDRAQYLPNAEVDYFKESGGNLAAVMTDGRHRMKISDRYRKLFGDKFEFRLYEPMPQDEVQIPMVCVMYFDDMIGLILPIKEKDKPE